MPASLKTITLRLENTLIVASGRDNARVGTELFLVLIVNGTALRKCEGEKQSKEPEGMKLQGEHDHRRLLSAETPQNWTREQWIACMRNNSPQATTLKRED